MRSSPFLRRDKTVYGSPFTDFSTIEHKLGRNVYTDIESFLSDANLVFDNCILYNPEGSIYAKSALKLAKFLKDMVGEDLKNMKNEL